MDDLYRDAAPSIGHRALAALVGSGKMPAIITQNIDGLHQASGVPAERIIELHGNGTYATCLSCGAQQELAMVRSRLRGDGRSPGLRSVRRHREVGDDLFRPGDAGGGNAACPRNRAQPATSSWPSARPWSSIRPPRFPTLAKRNGAKLVIINREPTELDEAADLVIHGEIGQIFGRFVSPQ